MSKHTPGPWEWQDGEEALVGPKHVVMLETNYGLTFAKYPGGEIEKANARLIAAAPDLLEALELADCVLSGRNMDLRVVAHKVHDALAKARGE